LRKNFPRSLHGAPFVLPTRHSKLRHDLDHYFRSHAIWVDPVAETQDTSFQKLLGVAGVGLIPAPLFAVDELLEDKSLVEIGRLPDLSEEIYLMSASRKIENPVARKLFENFKLV
jgi:LysR family transcriptional activator of nhaA